MKNDLKPILPRVLLLTAFLSILLVLSAATGMAIGSSDISLSGLFDILTRPGGQDSPAAVIVWQIRLPRVILAAAVGAVLALGGLVFQALLRNPLAEPYILGISGGAAVGAILGILSGLALFPWGSFLAFAGSMITLVLVIGLVAGRPAFYKDYLLLGGVMMNAFCGAIIMFLIYISRSNQVNNILFWLMGDLSMVSADRLFILLPVLPCFIIIFFFARPLNLLLMGSETAAVLGINVKVVTGLLLFITSFMVSLVVSLSGLIGFIGLLVPHVFRLVVGPDHRLLVPACILGGGSFLILCDLLARVLPAQGEMPVGIITALIGAPLFIFLLWRGRR